MMCYDAAEQLWQALIFAISGLTTVSLGLVVLLMNRGQKGKSGQATKDEEKRQDSPCDVAVAPDSHSDHSADDKAEHCTADNLGHASP